jgi:two-component system chemotaxis response regulator CheY
MRALIVDDQPDVCATLRGILTRDFGCTTVEASSGLEALGLLARESFDFVLLDLLLPGMDGMEVLRAIRAEERLAGLPVGVMSTACEEERVREAIDLGVGAFLTKPLDVAGLGERLQRLITGSTTAPALRRREWTGLPAGGRILVLDGNPDFLELVRSTLEPRYVVDVSAHGPAGFLKCLECRPDLVLMGENLGVLPGQVFVDTLRSLPQLAEVPVVGMVTPGRTEMTGRVDATITRTLQPDHLRRQVARTVAGESRLPH